MLVVKFHDKATMLESIDAFCAFRGITNKTIFPVPERLSDGLYEIPINFYLMQAYLEYLQNQTRPGIKDRYDVWLVYEDVWGFCSEKCVVNLIERFNKAKNDYWIDTSCEIESVQCLEGPIYVPVIEPSELYEEFWKFVSSSSLLRKAIKVGREDTRKEKSGG